MLYVLIVLGLSQPVHVAAYDDLRDCQGMVTLLQEGAKPGVTFECTPAPS